MTEDQINRRDMITAKIALILAAVEDGELTAQDLDEMIQDEQDYSVSHAAMVSALCILNH